MNKNNGKIYKYTNLINGMVYIGQTRTSLKQRDNKHISQISDHTYFHRALKKYGRENFSLEIIEDNIPLDQLNEKEKYYIDKFDSFYTTGKGYNLTQGGQWGSSHQILTISQSKEIKNMIANTTWTFENIGKKYGVTVYTISDINRGKSFHDDNIKYPIRPAPEKSVLDDEKVALIIDMLQNTNMNQLDIGLATNVLEYTVGEINRGKNSWCPKDLSYPIRKPIQANTYQNVLDKEQVKKIVYDLCFSSETLDKIGTKYGVAKNTVGDISRGISWKDITHQFVCPIRKNKLQNQEIYKSTYGIV